MATGAKKSKTNVAARSEAKKRQVLCKFCKNPISIIMSVTASGKKKMKRLCCSI